MKAFTGVLLALLAVCTSALYFAQSGVEPPTGPETFKSKTTLNDMVTCLTLIHFAESDVESPARSTTSETTITDAELLAYVFCPVDLDQVGQRIELGRINGTLVVANHYCSDLCPSNTVRVVHYELQDGRAAQLPVALKSRSLFPWVSGSDKGHFVSQSSSLTTGNSTSPVPAGSGGEPGDVPKGSPSVTSSRPPTNGPLALSTERGVPPLVRSCG